MDKNENGIPMPQRCCKNACDFPTRSCCCNSTLPDNDGMHNHTCGGSGNCLDEMALAYVYAPNQRFQMLYSANDALKHGTLFEELYKPKEVYGRE